jgi:hypothetical protein
MVTKPHNVELTCVRTTSLGIAVMILGDEGLGEITEPAVIRR